MTKAEYRHALELINTAITLFAHRRERPAVLRRRVRLLSREADLLRMRWGQPPPELRRN